MLYAYTLTRKWDVGFTVNGFLAGLVAITCPCYWVSPTGAVLLGGVAGVLVCLGVELLEWLRIDDPIGAVPVQASAEFGARYRWACLPAASMEPRGRFHPITRRPSPDFSTAAD